MGLRGLSRLTGVCVLKSGLITPIRMSLIVAPDKKQLKVQVAGFSKFLIQCHAQMFVNLNFRPNSELWSNTKFKLWTIRYSTSVVIFF